MCNTLSCSRRTGRCCYGALFSAAARAPPLLSWSLLVLSLHRIFVVLTHAMALASGPITYVESNSCEQRYEIPLEESQ
jgi:hypothetical protein